MRDRMRSVMFPTYLRIGRPPRVVSHPLIYIYTSMGPWAGLVSLVHSFIVEHRQAKPTTPLATLIIACNGL